MISNESHTALKSSKYCLLIDLQPFLVPAYLTSFIVQRMGPGIDTVIKLPHPSWSFKDMPDYMLSLKYMFWENNVVLDTFEPSNITMYCAKWHSNLGWLCFKVVEILYERVFYLVRQRLETCPRNTCTLFFKLNVIQIVENWQSHNYHV